MKPFIKSKIRQSIAKAYYATNHYRTRLQGKVIILMYHRVLPKEKILQHFIQPGMYVCDDVFERQIQFLKENFQILSFAELLGLWNGKGLERGKRYCVITFDDGWLDNFIYAYPILKKNRIPATIFLPASFIGTDQWFWPEKLTYLIENLNWSKVSFLLNDYVGIKGSLGWQNVPTNGQQRRESINTIIEEFKKVPEGKVNEKIEEMSMASGLKFPGSRVLLNWEEIREMSEYDISFGSHSSSHKILTGLSLKELQNEIEESLKTLQEKKINFTAVFCYPNGSFNQGVLEHVKAAGYKAAASTRFGYEGSFPQDLFCLKRISIHNDITSTIPDFLWRISGIEQALKGGSSPN